MSRVEAAKLLLSVLGEPQKVALSRATWEAAAILGGLRQASNDGLRSTIRDRGDTKNAAGDIQGCLGELLVGSLVEKRLPEAIVSCTGLLWDEPGDTVDLTVSIAGHVFLLETKCHLDAPQKRRFLINAVAAERSAARGARSFIPVISALGSSVASLGRPLRVRDVLAWPIEDFRYGDPARSSPLAAFIPDYFDLSAESALAAVRGKGVTPADALVDLAAHARVSWDELRASGLRFVGSPTSLVAALRQSLLPVPSLPAERTLS